MLIPNWKRAHKLLSVQAGALLVAWGLVPLDQQTAILALLHVPADLVPAIMGLLVIAGRLVSQPAQQA